MLAGAAMALGLAIVVLNPPPGLRALQDRVFDAMILALPQRGIRFRRCG